MSTVRASMVGIVNPGVDDEPVFITAFDSNIRAGAIFMGTTEDPSGRDVTAAGYFEATDVLRFGIELVELARKMGAQVLDRDLVEADAIAKADREFRRRLEAIEDPRLRAECLRAF